MRAILGRAAWSVRLGKGPKRREGLKGYSYPKRSYCASQARAQNRTGCERDGNEAVTWRRNLERIAGRIPRAAAKPKVRTKKENTK